MYCPYCGAKNNDPDAKFCRGCGEDLRLVSQAVTKRLSWPMYVASKIDNFMAMRSQKDPRDTGVLFLGYGVLSLVAGILNVRRGYPGFSAILFMSSFLALWIGLRNAWIYLRQRAGEYHPDSADTSTDLTVLRLSSSSTAYERPTVTSPEKNPATRSPITAPPSISESTTQQLEASGQEPRAKN